MQVIPPLHSMLYAENFGLHDCVGFSQIWSQITYEISKSLDVIKDFRFPERDSREYPDAHKNSGNVEVIILNCKISSLLWTT